MPSILAQWWQIKNCLQIHLLLHLTHVSVFIIIYYMQKLTLHLSTFDSRIVGADSILQWSPSQVLTYGLCVSVERFRSPNTSFFHCLSIASLQSCEKDTSRLSQFSSTTVVHFFRSRPLLPQSSTSSAAVHFFRGRPLLPRPSTSSAAVHFFRSRPLILLPWILPCMSNLILSRNLISLFLQQSYPILPTDSSQHRDLEFSKSVFVCHLQGSCFWIIKELRRYQHLIDSYSSLKLSPDCFFSEIFDLCQWGYRLT